MKVHSYFGSGFQETIYQRSLFIQLRKLSIDCDSEVETKVLYQGHPVGKKRLDIIV